MQLLTTFYEISLRFLRTDGPTLMNDALTTLHRDRPGKRGDISNALRRNKNSRFPKGKVHQFSKRAEKGGISCKTEEKGHSAPSSWFMHGLHDS
jgi:hypothetical protein